VNVAEGRGRCLKILYTKIVRALAIRQSPSPQPRASTAINRLI
jgi:hypothetical protein